MVLSPRRIGVVGDRHRTLKKHLHSAVRYQLSAIPLESVSWVKNSGLTVKEEGDSSRKNQADSR